MKTYELIFRYYRRPFLTPLRTHHGSWSIREGILLRLTSTTGEQSYGEIAPLPWFGSETLAQAWEFCQQLPEQITLDHLHQIPQFLTATQFGLESAWITLERVVERPWQTFSLCGLLPAGAAALDQWRALWDQGYRTFKWKIGVEPGDREWGILKELLADLPTAAQIRLDANGGLTPAMADHWLRHSDPTRIEFIEQPLAPQYWTDLLALSQKGYPIPIALDESVTTLEQLQVCYQQGWRGLFVIKPAVLGSPLQLQTWVKDHPVDLVFSSAFETPIGIYHGAQLFQELDLNTPRRAVGYGVEQYFQIGYPHLNGFQFDRAQIRCQFPQLWDHLDRF